MERQIIWTNHAIAQLNEEFLELLERTKSMEITARIINEVYDAVSILKTHSEIYKLDEFKKNNPGTIRAFEKHTYRISYQIDADTIFIIRLKYARKEPKIY
jgi:mRNA-degrading endonuclease RelE of RelBE toxin-antitoxin system